MGSKEEIGKERRVTRMGTDRLIIISSDNIPAGRSPGRPKIRRRDLIPGYNRRNRL
jgi:hypothetical protein